MKEVFGGGEANVALVLPVALCTRLEGAVKRLVCNKTGKSYKNAVFSGPYAHKLINISAL